MFYINYIQLLYQNISNTLTVKTISFWKQECTVQASRKLEIKLTNMAVYEVGLINGGGVYWGCTVVSNGQLIFTPR